MVVHCTDIETETRGHQYSCKQSPFFFFTLTYSAVYLGKRQHLPADSCRWTPEMGLDGCI